jgi:hypothetical protein
MRRDPRFDSLEERSLLSGSFPTADFHAGGFVSPQFQMDHVNSPFPVDHGFSVIFIFRSGSPFPSGQSWPSLSSGYQMPDSDGSMQGQPPAAGPGQLSGNMADPSGGQVPPHNEHGPIASSSVSSAPSLGFPVIGSPKSQPGTTGGGRDGAERISSSTGTEGIVGGPDGVSVTAGKEVAQESSGIGNGPLEPTVAGLPAQLGALMTRESLWNARLLDARSLALDGLDRSSVAGQLGTAHGGIDQEGNAPIGRTALGFAANGSPLAVGRPAVMPNPQSADLIANVLPCDRGALDRAIEQFFQQVDELDGSGPRGHGAARIVFLSAALVGSFAGLDIVRRRWRHWKAGDDFRVRDPVGGGDHIGFPELPGAWSSRLT